MEARIYKLLILISLLGFAGCSDDYDRSLGVVPSLHPHYLSISKTSFGGASPYFFTETARITTISTPWKFSTVPEWVSITPMWGGIDASLTLRAEENKSAVSGRTSIFYLESTDPEWKMSRPLTVSQGAATPYAIPSSTSIELAGSGTGQTIQVETNCDWKGMSTAAWLQVSKSSNGALTVKGEENPGSLYRTATINITTADDSSRLASVSVTQAPAKVETSSKTITFENTASSCDIRINSEADWTAVASASWIQVSPASGKGGSSSVNVEVTPNTSVSERTGYVTFSTGSIQKLQITIVQQGIYIETSESFISLPAAESSLPLSIKSNTKWTLSSSPEWIAVSSTSGDGSAELTLGISENNSTYSRSGEIVFGQEGLDVSAAVKVVQQGKSLNPDTYLLEFDDKSSKKVIKIEGDSPWKASSGNDWITLSPTEGTGSGSITVGVTENVAAASRTGEIKIDYLDKSFSVSVWQLAKYVNVEGKAFTFASRGGENTLNIATNDGWTLQKDDAAATWLTLSPESGDGEENVVIVAADNPSVNPRSCNVRLDLRNLQDVMFPVSQSARFLKLSTQNVLFYAKGGKSEPIAIDTDGKYEITTEDDWITIAQSTQDTFTITVSENTVSFPREGKVLIKMTDLAEGSLTVELPVVQYTSGSSFIIDGYGEDIDEDSVGGSQLNITVKRFTTDKNLDFPGTPVLSVKIEGYKGDKNYDSEGADSVDVSISGYSPDKKQD